MANEVTVVELYGQNNSGDIRRYTCASNVAITKGTVLTLSDGRTAAANTTLGSIFGGIASAGKSATDLATTIPAWTNGIFTFTASGAITAGDKVRTASSGNKVEVLTVNTASTQVVVGYALDSVIDAADVEVRVNI